MSHKKKVQVQKCLQESKKLYEKELRKATEITREVLRELGHIEADSNLFSGLCLSARIHTLRKLIDKADEALAAVTGNNYGICKTCKKPISPARLKAVPFTEYCAGCKTEIEEKDTISENGVPRRISRMIQNNITP